MVEIQGVSKDEMNLVRVSRYYHENITAIEAVVAKLGNVIGLDSSSIAAMTGFSIQRVGAIVRAHRKPNAKPFKQAVAESNAAPEVKKALNDFVDERAPETKVVDHLEDEKPRTHNAKYVDVANGIIDLIDELNLEKGDKLPTSLELAAKFGVATATITNAIAHLRQKGVVNSQRGRGITVA